VSLFTALVVLLARLDFPGYPSTLLEGPLFVTSLDSIIPSPRTSFEFYACSSICLNSRARTTLVVFASGHLFVTVPAVPRRSRSEDHTSGNPTRCLYIVNPYFKFARIQLPLTLIRIQPSLRLDLAQESRIPA
jgi:hypothetical protein